MQAKLDTVYKEYHAAKCTFRPELIDNLNILEGQEKLEQAQVENKDTELTLLIVEGAIQDVKDLNGKASLAEIKEYFLDDFEAFEDAKILYGAVERLCETLTVRQFQILFKYVVQRWRITDIAEHYEISSPAVINFLKLIRKKSKKLKIIDLI